MQYTVDFFIDKFEKIPEELWCVNFFYNSVGQFCAYGHCGMSGSSFDFTSEAKSLHTLFGDYLSLRVDVVNDGDSDKYEQPTPKQRILAALYDIKNMQPRKDITASLAQDAVQERLDVVKVKEVERV